MAPNSQTIYIEILTSNKINQSRYLYTYIVKEVRLDFNIIPKNNVYRKIRNVKNSKNIKNRQKQTKNKRTNSN